MRSFDSSYRRLLPYKKNADFIGWHYLTGLIRPGKKKGNLQIIVHFAKKKASRDAFF